MSAERRPIRITYVIVNLELGGAESQLVRLVNGLDRSRFKPSVMCLEPGDELEGSLAPDVEVVKPRGKPTRRGVRNRAVRAVRMIASAVGPLRRLEPDIVHAYLPAAYVIGGLTAWMLRVPSIVASRRGLNALDGPGRLIAMAVNNVIDVQICNAIAVRDYAIARERLALDRTRVIPNGIDVPPSEPAPRIPAEWQSAAGNAAMVANLIRYKGHAEVLEAMRLVVHRHPAFRLVFFGDGPEHDRLLHAAARMDLERNVVFAGRRKDAAALMPAFDFTILGSSEEGFPNVLLESLARSVPIVSTSVGGVPELVTDGVEGRLVGFGDIEGMSSAISWMIEHPDDRRRMGEAGRRRVASDFSTKRMVDCTVAVYEELLSRRVLSGSARPAHS